MLAQTPKAVQSSGSSKMTAKDCTSAVMAMGGVLVDLFRNPVARLA